jgi:hypothetical protein
MHTTQRSVAVTRTGYIRASVAFSSFYPKLLLLFMARMGPKGIAVPHPSMQRIPEHLFHISSSLVISLATQSEGI